MAYLGAGWSRPDVEQVWSQATAARIWVPLTRGQRILRLELTAFLAPSHPRQRVQVRIDTQVVQEMVIDRPGLHVLEIQVDGRGVIDDPGRQGRLLSLDLGLPDAVSPLQLGMSADPRKLGVGLVSLSVR